MSTADHVRTSKEIANRGEEIYSRDLKAKLEAECQGKIVAVDVDSGNYAVADTILEASRLVRAKHPQAEIFLQRVGDRILRRFGSRTNKSET